MGMGISSGGGGEAVEDGEALGGGVGGGGGGAGDGGVEGVGEGGEGAGEGVGVGEGGEGGGGVEGAEAGGELVDGGGEGGGGGGAGRVGRGPLPRTQHPRRLQQPALIITSVLHLLGSIRTCASARRARLRRRALLVPVTPLGKRGAGAAELGSSWRKWQRAP